MADLNNTSATKALNENDYINKLYDTNLGSQKELLQQNYEDNTGVLDTEKQSVQQQTDDNVTRTYVEAAKAAGIYKQPSGSNVSAGANAQAALAQGNQQQKNVTTLKGVQNEADAEIERQRSLLASQFSAAIKQAQADNDMQRAQALYEAAKSEENQLLSLKKQAGTMLAEKGDNSILHSLLNGGGVAPDTSSPTWSEVLKNEDSINEIYDSQQESEKLGLQMEQEEALSDLDAEQQKARRETDKSLTDTYVDSLRKAKNYAEVQRAYGMGSGTFEQARLAQDMQLQSDLTGLRGVQMQADAGIGQQRFDVGKSFRDQVARMQAESDYKRAQALYDAAEAEEQKLVSTQQTVGNQLAKQNNYSILGNLYGLTQDQIDRMQGTGIYAPVEEDGGDDDGGSGGQSITMNTVLESIYGDRTNGVNNDKKLTASQAAQFEKNMRAAIEQDKTSAVASVDQALVNAQIQAGKRNSKKRT